MGFQVSNLAVRFYVDFGSNREIVQVAERLSLAQRARTAPAITSLISALQERSNTLAQDAGKT
jgi:hypothetical protein